MHYNGPIIRPHTEANDLFVEVTVGCTHNSCTFCNFYHGYPFRMASLEQVEADLQEARRYTDDPGRIWASGGNPYAMSTERLSELGRLFKKYFPNTPLATYARVDDLNLKTVEEMQYLRDFGWDDLVIGIESGDDDVLRHVNKGYTAADILEGCRRLEQAGVRYRVIYLGGLAGKGHGIETAHRTAVLLNQLHPYYLFLTTVSVLPGTELYEERARGEFVEMGERERLDELITLLDKMKNDIRVFQVPNTTRITFDIDLQKEKADVLPQLRRIRDETTDEDEARMQAYRDSMTGV